MQGQLIVTLLTEYKNKKLRSNMSPVKERKNFDVTMSASCTKLT